jgi:hypothetical protein
VQKRPGSFLRALLLLSERKKIKCTNLGLAKKDKQLDESKLCSFFAKPQKQIGMVYFSSITSTAFFA